MYYGMPSVNWVQGGLHVIGNSNRCHTFLSGKKVRKKNFVASNNAFQCFQFINLCEIGVLS